MPTQKKKVQESEDDKKLAAQKQDEAKDAPAAPAPAGDDEEHDDADQDKKLIADMIKKHMGDGDSGDDNKGDKKEEAGDGQDMSEALEAYEAYSAMGHKAEDAAKMAASHVKASKHMASKKAESEAAKEAESKKEEASSDKALGQQKESNAKKDESDVLKLAGRVSFLEAELRKERLDKYINTKIRESGLVGKAKDSFLASAGKITGEKDLDTKLALFLEGRNQKTADGDFGFILNHEPVKRGSEKETETISFKDCVK